MNISALLARILVRRRLPMIAVALAAALISGPLGLLGSPAPAFALQDPEPPTNTPTPTPTPTSTPVYSRPLLTISSYSHGGPVIPGEAFSLNFTVMNSGQTRANNIIIVFSSGDLAPIGNGGVIIGQGLDAGASASFNQGLHASSMLQKGDVATLNAQISYVDDSGNSQSGSFVLAIGIGSAPTPSRPSAGRPAPTATPTPTPGARPQLLVRSYQTDVPVLKPGTQFGLSLSVENVGGRTAKRISMIVGGGSRSGPGSGQSGNDPGGGGLSASGGDFANFVPLGSSNVQFLGDLEAERQLKPVQQLVVNSSTKPGAYTVKISFVYEDMQGVSYTDDQVIALLVVSPPLLEISTYRPPDPLFVGQPSMLPIQVLNLDRSSVILGRMIMEGEGAEWQNNSAIVGYLDPSGYFPLDAVAIPFQPGPLVVVARVHYQDDFNQPQVIEQSFTFDVLEMSDPDIGIDGPYGEDPGPMDAPAETIWQKIWRFILGLLGLDSAPPDGGLPGEPGLEYQEEVPALPPPRQG